MKVLVSGSHGFIGSHLIPALVSRGHTVIRLVRRPVQTGDNAVFWNPATASLDSARLEGMDAVVHLAGESVVGRWTSAKKTAIRDSRVQGTRFLCESLARLSAPPRVLISASATGYYGSRGGEILREESSSGTGFLADVCRRWESATEPALQKKIRVVNARAGVALGPAGGALARMLLPFRLGLGGKIGGGSQYMSWISMDDLTGALLHALETESLRGPVNIVSPNPATNLEFTKTLGKVLKRPTPFPLPAFAARILFGGLADEMLLASARVEPARLLASGFRFAQPDLENALRNLLKN